MRTILITTLVHLTFLSAFSQTLVPSEKQAFSIGETLKFESLILNETRTLNIYLPLDYNQDSLQRYPVIYLLDGSADEDFIHIAGLVQFGSFSWINMLPESIVVGIANIDRKRDFTYPTQDLENKKDLPTSGGSARFIEFIENEVQPLINKSYHCNSNRTIIGQSLGGLVATEILFIKPQLFDNYIIVSPSLWWDDESLLERQAAEASASRSVYVGVGKEGEVMERVARSLFKKLDSSATKSSELHFGFFEEQNHGDVLHLAVYDAFEKLFGESK